MEALAKRNNIVQAVHQSPPVDTSAPYDATWVAGKTILITGGASGFGEGFFRKWAENGANVIIGDINDARGQALVDEVREATGSQHHHYIHCDVTNWQSQVDFFHEAIKLSPTGGIDTVVANAGIADHATAFEAPKNLDADTPRKPNLKCFEVNLLGVMYTAHLAIYYLQRNPHSEAASADSAPSAHKPDRHLLLIGSIASVCPLPAQVLYGTAKHGVMGLFRTLRATEFINGIRVNMLCPYFIATPLIPAPARMLLAGGAMGVPEDVVDAGTRLVADTRIMGRALVIGPKVRMNDEWEIVPQMAKDGKELAVWEVYGHDFEETEVWTSRIVRILNQVEAARGWIGWARDMVGALVYPFAARRR
ncbi:hypothetical protein B7494_g1918 [Chlorociboria aeruginascens]|nr:hypothetical protein B7494_g1918 [Chlorociboria aeruginascens]